MNNISITIQIHWMTISLITLGVVVCIFAYSRFCYSQRDDDKPDEGG